MLGSGTKKKSLPNKRPCNVSTFTYYKYNAVNAQKIVKDEGKKESNEKNLMNFITPNITNKELQLNLKSRTISFKSNDNI